MEIRRQLINNAVRTARSPQKPSGPEAVATAVQLGHSRTDCFSAASSKPPPVELTVPPLPDEALENGRPKAAVGSQTTGGSTGPVN